MALLYFRVSTDFDFLMSTLKDVSKIDTNISQLMNIMEQVHEEGIRQPIGLMIQETVDYCT